jgi:hypothetical protein
LIGIRFFLEIAAMFANRISELFQLTSVTGNVSPSAMAAATAAQLLPVISTHDIYQMAAAKARYDYELDKLFNPDYYGDGSGI